MPVETAGAQKRFWEGWEDVPGVFLEDLPVETAGMTAGPLWSLSAQENQEISHLIREQSSSKEAIQKLAAFLSAWKELEQEIWIVVSQDAQARRLRDILSFYQLKPFISPSRNTHSVGKPPVSVF